LYGLGSNRTPTFGISLQPIVIVVDRLTFISNI
jgi:hypothetical protein